MSNELDDFEDELKALKPAGLPQSLLDKIGKDLGENSQAPENVISFSHEKASLFRRAFPYLMAAMVFLSSGLAVFSYFNLKMAQLQNQYRPAGVPDQAEAVTPTAAQEENNRDESLVSNGDVLKGTPVLTFTNSPDDGIREEFLNVQEEKNREDWTRVVDEGQIYLDGNIPVRQVRKETLQKVKYKDPGSNKVYILSRPQEEVMLIRMDVH